MSDCSTQAMKPKEPIECGFSGVKILRLLEPQGEPDIIECDGARYIPEQRYEQLEQVALDMLREIKTMAGSTCYTSDLDYEHKHEWIEDCVRPWRSKLEALGVSVDD